MAQIHLDVDYYDDDQRDILLRQENADQIRRLVDRGLTMDAEEFFLNATFKHQWDKDGFRTRAELARLIPRIRDGMLPEFFELGRGSVHSRDKGQDLNDTASTEYCGVAASLGVANRIYGLTEADWERIGIAGIKDLDFRKQASDGQKFVRLEAKGAVVEDLEKVSELSAAKRSILGKKEEQRPLNPRDVYLGVIAAFPVGLEHRAKCRLVDPIIEDVPENPLKYKLLARLAHYHRELNLLIRAHFVIALAGRIQALSLIEDYAKLSGQSLIDRNGEPFKEPNLDYSTRSVVRDSSAFGEVVSLANGRFYFYGLRHEIPGLMINQSHQEILEFRMVADQVGSANARVTARLYKDELTKANIDVASLKRVPNSARLEIEMRGTLTTTVGGHVIGEIAP